MRMTAAEAARLLGARLVGEGGALLTGAEVDSRRVEAGDLFVALPGSRRDGHEFVAEALGRAAAALVREGVEVPPPPAGTALLVVADPMAAYEALAAAERRRRPWRVAALTGAVGKTTVKEMLARLLAARFLTGASEGNRNSTLGLPAEILSQPAEVEVLVAEMGMNHPGELHRLAAIVAPDLLLYTRIAPVHMEFFPDLAAVAEAKAEALAHVRRGGTLVINADDPWQAGFPDRRPDLRTVRYGRGDAHVRLVTLEARGLEGSHLEIAAGGERVAMDLPLPGRHQAENLLAAAAAAWALGVPLAGMAAVAARLEPAPRRGRVHRLASGVTVVDDSYNASPAAVAAALELLAATAGRRVAVLGEMYELGAAAPAAHAEAGRRAASTADVLVAVGGEHAGTVAGAARAAGMPEGAVHLVPDAEAAARLLERLLEPGDVVLVKGSRGVELDRTVDALVGGGGGA